MKKLLILLIIVATAQVVIGNCYYQIYGLIHAEGLDWTMDHTPNGNIQLLDGDQVKVVFQEQLGGICPPTINAFFFNGDTMDLFAGTMLVDQVGDYRFETYIDYDGVYEVLAEYSFSIVPANNTVESCGLSVGVLLGGAMDPDTSNYSWMLDGLRQDGYLPAQEPYTALGYSVTQGAGMVADPADFADQWSPVLDAVDWVFVELRDTADPIIVLHSTVALISRAGWAHFNLDVIPGKFYVAIHHRNHLAIMSDVPVSLSNYRIQCDMRKTDFPVFGNEPTIGVAFNQRALWPGNAIDDDEVKYSGLDNDRDAILVAIGGLVPTNTVAGYLNTDLNLDGITKYSGANNDRDIILHAIGGLIPTATRVEQLP